MPLTSQEAAGIRGLLTRATLRAMPKLVWLYLFTYGERARPSKTTVAADLGIDKRTVHLAYNELRAAGLLHELEGKRGGHATLAVQLRLIPGGKGGSDDPGIPGSPDPSITPGMNEGSPRGGSHDHRRGDPGIPRSPRIEEEFQIDPPPLVPALEEDGISLRSPDQPGDGADEARRLQELAERHATAWPGSTLDRRVAALRVALVKVGRNGRPFLVLTDPPAIQDEATFKHLRLYGRLDRAGQLDARELGERGSPTRPAPAPSSPPAMTAEDEAAAAEGLAALRKAAEGLAALRKAGQRTRGEA